MGNTKLELEQQKNERLGEIGYNISGHKMTIIEYFNSSNITIQFENNSVVKNRGYGDFKKGNIKKPENRLGEVNYNKQGEKMTIVGYFSATDISVQFESGYTIKNVTYDSFKKGKIKNITKRIGEISFNNFGTKMTIIEYINSNNITVQFENGYIVKKTTYLVFKKGNVKSPYDKSVFGHGYLGEGEYKASINREDTVEYSIWRGILQRCYDKKFQERHITYQNCTIATEWLNFQTFAKWYNDNYYEIEKNQRMDLDKDILIKGNKIYSPETCLFVPQFINKLFIKNDKSRGKLPIGVFYRKEINKYTASCSNGKGIKHEIGKFSTPEEAFYLGYKPYKENLIKQIANEYKDKISNKLYEAMYNWKVEITD